jgi:serine/threonine-protein kinase
MKAERSETATQIDSIIATLLRRLAELPPDARQGEFQKMAAEHPQLAAELRELWALSCAADHLGAADNAPTLHPRSPEHLATGAAPVPFPLTAGATWDYELIEKIGEGGMGVVYKARQKSLDRVVALKMIRRGALATPSEERYFRAEAGAAARLEHPHIVPVYEVGECGGCPFFTMKLVAGTTLAQRIAQGLLDGKEAAELLLPVCQAVAFAHQQGIVHRDLKPSNILIDEQGRPMIADFGLARQLHAAPGSKPVQANDHTASGAILGTPSYMSPEQAAGERGRVGPSSDVYSLGAILYQCLTGRPPFVAAASFDVVMMVLEQEPVLPRLLNPRADADLEMIALKCLQKPPELRYVSAQALAADLQAYLANEPISARSTGISQLISRMLRETHHASVLENWGLLWMWHSLVLLLLCGATNLMAWQGVTQRLPYLALWVLGLGAWAIIFWRLRRRAGPILFVERQIAHVWGASMAASSLLFAVEALLRMPVLALSPVLPLFAASVFVVKAGILSGAFYVQSVLLFATALAMAAFRLWGWPDFGLLLYGVVSAGCFFWPGFKYHRQRRRGH